MTLPVIFRADRLTGQVLAIFPTEAATLDPAEFTTYAHIGQHSAGSHAWYAATTRPATPFEYTPLLLELRALYGVSHGPGDTAITLRVVKRFTRGFDEARYAQVRALRTIRQETRCALVNPETGQRCELASGHGGHCWLYGATQ